MTLFKSILSSILPTKDWEINVSGNREEIIAFFSWKFKTTNEVVGDTSWKSIYFMHTSVEGLHNYSLVGFDGEIIEGEPSTIKFRARFGQPFGWIYVLAALSFPIVYILNFQNARENLHLTNSHFLNILLPPSVIWGITMFYYQAKLMDGKRFVQRAIEEYELRRKA